MHRSQHLLTDGEVAHDTKVVVLDYTVDGNAMTMLPAKFTKCVYVRGLSLSMSATSSPSSVCGTVALGIHIGLVGNFLAPVGEVVVFQNNPETCENAVVLAELLLALKISPVRSFGASASLTMCHAWYGCTQT